MNQWTAILPLALSLSLFACDSGSAPAAPAKPAEAAPAKPADAAPAKPADAAPATPADETKEALDEADAALKAAGELGQLDSLKALGDAKGLSGVVDEDDLSCSKGSCVQQLA
ncbi:MAG: hypothetical protein KC468_02300, partial [Myxococcales bacterium]|nr:hypothetical protein [Myxococcales bacterium]